MLFTEADAQALIDRAYAKGGVDEDNAGCSLAELIDPRLSIAYKPSLPPDAVALTPTEARALYAHLKGHTVADVTEQLESLQAVTEKLASVR